jgi:hypothetical protein
VSSVVALSLAKEEPSAPPPTRIKQKDVSADKAKQPDDNRPDNREPIPVSINGSVNVVDAAAAEQIRANAEERAKPIWKKQEWVMVFVTAAAAFFAFLAFVVAALQAKYLKKQLRVATSARLSVEGVRMVKFEIGEKPVFFVKIVNSGPADAEKVMVDIRVEPAKAGVNGVKYSAGAQPIDIPANSCREYFIELKERLTAEVQDGIKNKNWPLRVTGFTQESGQEQKDYDYRYYPWNPRPKDVPEFIPSEFNTRRTTLIIPAVADTTEEALAPTVTGGKPKQ